MPDEAVKKAMEHPDKLGAGAEKRSHLSPEHKREAVMGEFHKGTLHSGSGEKVSNPKQAVAIAYSEARKNLSKHVDDYHKKKAVEKHPSLKGKEST